MPNRLREKNPNLCASQIPENPLKFCNLLIFYYFTWQYWTKTLKIKINFKIFQKIPKNDSISIQTFPSRPLFLRLCATPKIAKVAKMRNQRLILSDQKLKVEWTLDEKLSDSKEIVNVIVANWIGWKIALQSFSLFFYFQAEVIQWRWL